MLLDIFSSSYGWQDQDRLLGCPEIGDVDRAVDKAQERGAGGKVTVW